MKTKYLTIVGLLISIIAILPKNSNAQNVGISATGTVPEASAGLDVDFSDKGLLIPRIALVSTDSESPVTTPATSLLIYNTATAGTAPTNVFPGYYFWNGAIWQRFKTVKNRKFLPADVSSSSTTLGNVTDLSFPVEVGVTYRFKFFICYTSSATGTGSRWTINGPTSTTLRFLSSYPSSTTANSFYHQSAYNGGSVTSGSNSTGNNIAIIEGIITCSSNTSEVIARIAAEAATITAKADVSYVEWEVIE
ncbi:MAG: hypothetical protein K9I48_05420 [Sphingobacteriales bacterium]|jgi:hypothetical protein|nr:hypothetical protein [Sphingobacteriales bacterium]